MSARFSVLSWLSRLNDPAACIVGGRLTGMSCYFDGAYRPEGEYYALAEDRRGYHYPFPKLPRVLRFVFRATVVVHNRRGIQHPVRGIDWWFRFPCCGAKSPFKPGGYRNRICSGCGTILDTPDRGRAPIWSAVWWWESFPCKWRNFIWKLHRPFSTRWAMLKYWWRYRGEDAPF